MQIYIAGDILLIGCEVELRHPDIFVSFSFYGRGKGGEISASSTTKHNTLIRGATSIITHKKTKCNGLSPSGKAQDFDSCIHRFESG